MPKSSTTHTLYHAQLRDTGTGELLRVISQRWSLRKEPLHRRHTGRLCWFTEGNPAPFCYASHAGSPGRMYPQGWHPSEGDAVLAFYEKQHADLQAANLVASEARTRRSLASDWLWEKARQVIDNGPQRSTAEQLKDPEVRQFVNADHARRGGAA